MERGLHQFLAVAETGSISAASKKLFVTQPTITVNIRNLEDRYQVPLFERTSRGMVLTPFGSILYEKARIMARLEEQTEREIERRRGQTAEIMGVGCGHAWWTLFVRDAVGQAASNRPQASVHVETGSNLYCMWKLLGGEILVSIGHQVPNLDPGIGAEFQKLFTAVDALFVAEGHPLLGRRCTRNDLADVRPINSVPIDKMYRDILTKTDEPTEGWGLGPSVSRAYSTNSLVTCADMVKQSWGYTTFPSDMTDSLKELGLVPLDIDEVFEAKEVGLYYLSEQAGNPLVRELVARISASAADYAQNRLGR